MWKLVYDQLPQGIRFLSVKNVMQVLNELFLFPVWCGLPHLAATDRSKMNFLPQVISSSTYMLGDREIKSGDLVKITKDKGTYIFQEYETNVETGSEWINVIHATEGYFDAFKPERLVDVSVPEKPRRKKKNG
jgi:hypothetical protein